MVRIAFSGQGQGIGEIGFGFTILLIQATGWRGLKTHAPLGEMGKVWRICTGVLQVMLRDMGLR